MSKHQTGDKIEKEEILRAVVVIDDFEDVFNKFLKEECSALLPLAAKCCLDYTLENLQRSSVQETLLFCSSKADVIRNYISKSQWSNPGSVMKVVVLVSEQCTSIGDAIRDIDNKGLIKSDFILTSTSAISNINLQTALKYHRSQCKKDKGIAMTMILHDCGSSQRSEESIIAMNSDTDKLLFYAKQSSSPKINIPMEYILNNPRITLSTRLRDTGISICSPSAPIIFSDNFDFQSKEDFIRGILLNEEVLAGSIYAFVSTDYGNSVQDWASYQRVTSDVIRRWTYPFVPDVPFGRSDSLVHQRGFVYKHRGVNLSKGCKLEEDVVIGKQCVIGSNVRLLRCVLGENCIIEDDASIEDSYLMSGVHIKSNAKISLSVLGDNVSVSAGCHLRNCQLHHSVVLCDNIDLEDTVLSSSSTADSEKLGDSAFIVPKESKDSDSESGHGTPIVRWLKNPMQDSDEEVFDCSDSESDESRPPSPEADDCTLFYSEVMDSLQRGYEERLHCDNLILEVNSSRYAYNVTLSEVTMLTSKAVFSLPSRMHCAAKPVLQFFKPLFDNYVRTEEGQGHCLNALEETYEALGNELNGCIHFLYDSEILSEEAIVSWYEGLDEDMPIREKLEKFITWLNEAAEESDDD